MTDAELDKWGFSLVPDDVYARCEVTGCGEWATHSDDARNGPLCHDHAIERASAEKRQIGRR